MVRAIIQRAEIREMAGNDTPHATASRAISLSSEICAGRKAKGHACFPEALIPIGIYWRAAGILTERGLQSASQKGQVSNVFHSLID
jgi:hypothetical protein